ncbi:MAG: hypothetical protein KAT38_11185 [Bacteroidales bacterium]|nr:hypothetical protein [Bacteroidales bacterium]
MISISDWILFTKLLESDPKKRTCNAKPEIDFVRSHGTEMGKNTYDWDRMEKYLNELHTTILNSIMYCLTKMTRDFVSLIWIL